MSVKPETSYPAVLGGVLVNKRKQRGLSQREMAERVDTSNSTWSRVESGESSLSIPQLQKVAEALGTTVGKILQEADEMVERLKAQGVKVHAEHQAPGLGKAGWAGLALVSAAAIAGLIATLSQDDDDDI